MFVMVKLAVWMMMGIISMSYGMDEPYQSPVSKITRSEYRWVEHIINESCKVVNPRGSDIKKRVSAAHRIYATSDSGGVYCHKNIINGCLRSPDGKSAAWAHDTDVIIAHKDKNKYSVNIIPMKTPIKSCAFNAKGFVFACASDQELVVCDLSFGDYLKKPKVRLDLLFSDIKHVALSDSGNRVAVGVDNSDGVRILVINTQTGQLLHDLAGTFLGGNFRFFYMMGENIVAMCFHPQCVQYDLDVLQRFAQLTKMQKDFLCTIYDYYSSMQKRMCLLRYSNEYALYVNLPIGVRLWARKYLSFRSCSR